MKNPRLNFNARMLDFASLSVFVLVLAGFGYIAFSRGGVDYRGYHAAAMLALRGGNPYDYSQLAPVLEEIAGFQSNNPFSLISGRTSFGFPPFFMPLVFPAAVPALPETRGSYPLLAGFVTYPSIYIIFIIFGLISV